MSFLYKIFDNLIVQKEISKIILPNHIIDNLKSDFSIRPYQIESFKRFIYLYNENFDAKPQKPYHLLYNMATGSGKTLVMAGLMLDLYEKGYRNFLFFVNSNNIIKKTKDNFLNPKASKYLFSKKIVIDGNDVQIKETNNFESIDNKSINIKFTTIQQLHIDLNNSKENNLTYEDFKNKKMVLIADEAHHLSSATRNNGDLLGSWEGTVLEIVKQNLENILLEFTATIDYANEDIVKKYKNKVIFKYDLAQFRIDKFSKEINLVRSYYNEKERIIQALIINLYRQELATSNNINLKPVILFKAKKTIKESEQNKLNFHLLIDEISVEMIENIKKTATIEIVQKAFDFFEAKNFKKENCISANDDNEAELNQIRLNTLEDDNNSIRAIFAVQKLNEGWDVLNLFDIVRLYDNQNVGEKTTKIIGSTTLSEAQLIGRGARYFPFTLEEGQDKFTRKFDNEPANDLKILEELYYHTKEDSRYISELKKALIESGIYENDEKRITKQFTLKLDFIESDFYKNGKVFFNKKIKKKYTKVDSIADFGVKKRNFSYVLTSGEGKLTTVFNSNDETLVEKTERKNIAISKIPQHIIRYAISQNPFFYFNNIERYFPQLNSISNFIQSENYLGNFEITFIGTKTRISEISNNDYLFAIQEFLQLIETEIKLNSTEFEGSEFFYKNICEIFKNKTLNFYNKSDIETGQETMLAKEPWYVFNANYGTKEERYFVSKFQQKIKQIEQNFEYIYLIRNERTIKLYDKIGRAFEPDFILFYKHKNNNKFIYQIFIETSADKRKELILQEIIEEEKIIKIENYFISGISFHKNFNENDFKKIFNFFS